MLGLLCGSGQDWGEGLKWGVRSLMVGLHAKSLFMSFRLFKISNTAMQKNPKTFYHSFHQWNINHGYMTGWHWSTPACKLPSCPPCPGLEDMMDCKTNWLKWHQHELMCRGSQPLPAHPLPLVLADLILLSVFSGKTRPSLWSGKITGLTCFGGEAASDHR